MAKTTLYTANAHARMAMSHARNDLESYFKYAKFRTAWAMLENQTLRWSRPEVFNDPFDMQLELQLDFDPEVVTDLALQNIWRRCNGQSPPATSNVAKLYEREAAKLTKSGRNYFNKALRAPIRASVDQLPELTKKFRAEFLKDTADIKLLCLSEIKNSILMWSHYADDHRGVVLEFKNAEDFDSPYKSARRINYTNVVPQLADAQEVANIISGDGKLTKELLDRVIYSKSAAWEYEHEVRIASGLGRAHAAITEDVSFHAPELRAVYMGCRSAPDDTYAISNMLQARYPHAEMWEAVRGTKNWDLAFRRIF